MKRIIGIVICVIAVFVMSGIVQAAESWPGPRPMLLYKLASGDQRCAIYALGRGSVEVDCATKAGESWTPGPIAKCLASRGVKQVCSTTLEFNSFDTTAVKCSKVCGGATNWKRY
jgi:hypothetical protein